MNDIKMAIKLLESAISANLCYTTMLSDDLTDYQPPNDLGNRLTKIMLKVVSEDTLVMVAVLYLIEKRKKK